MAAARRVVISIAAPRAGEAPDEYVFGLKTRLTAIRAAAPATLMLGLAADVPTMTFVLALELGSYVDFVVVDGRDRDHEASMYFEGRVSGGAMEGDVVRSVGNEQARFKWTAVRQ